MPRLKHLSNRHREALQVLQSLEGLFDRSCLATDPVCHVHRYADPRDQEMAGLVSALLSFGNVKSIQASLQRVLGRMGPHPAEFVAGFRDRPGICDGLGHRWVRGEDLRLLFQVLHEILKAHDTVEQWFAQGNVEDDVSGLLDRVSRDVQSLVPRSQSSRGFRCFFPTPQDGSPCKRLNMYLRWMVRPPDGIDLGLWSRIRSSQLIVPLDTHVYRFGMKYRLSRLKTASWDFAADVTSFLKKLDPNDPVKYDFAICHYGMEKGW